MKLKLLHWQHSGPFHPCWDHQVRFVIGPTCISLFVKNRALFVKSDFQIIYLFIYIILYFRLYQLLYSNLVSSSLQLAIVCNQFDIYLFVVVFYYYIHSILHIKQYHRFRGRFNASHLFNLSIYRILPIKEVEEVNLPMEIKIRR